MDIRAKLPLIGLDAFRSGRQHTLARTIHRNGTGLHSGATVMLELHPAEPDTGIVFMRLDRQGDEAFIPADPFLVTDTRLGTTLTNRFGVTLQTVEHLMAALWGCGIDNAYVGVEGPEMPIMDGSSNIFLEMIEQAGLGSQAAPRRRIVVTEAMELQDGESWVRIEPAANFALDIRIDYPHDAIGKARHYYDFGSEDFSILALARTFGFAHEVEYLRSIGLARGGSLENAIVVGEQGVLNEEGLRVDDEFIRHKALDCVGDYYLGGHTLQALVTAHKPGHTINNKLMRALLANKAAWHFAPAPKAAATEERRAIAS